MLSFCRNILDFKWLSVVRQQVLTGEKMWKRTGKSYEKRIAWTLSYFSWKHKKKKKEWGGTFNDHGGGVKICKLAITFV